MIYTETSKHAHMHTCTRARNSSFVRSS